MKEIDKLVLAADHYGTIIDVVGTYGGEVAALSPAAKDKIRRILFDKGAPPKDAHPALKAAWEAVK